MVSNKTRIYAAIVPLFILILCSQVIADPIGEVDTIGHTWCEWQWGCANSGPQIAIDSINGAVYVVWSFAPVWNNWGSYCRFNCYLPDSGWAYGDTGLWILGGHHEYQSVMLKSHGGSRQDIEITTLSGSFDQRTQRAWWNGNDFEYMPLDTIDDPQEHNPFPAICINGTINLLAAGDGLAFGKLFYCRYSLNPFSFAGWLLVDTISAETYRIAASPVSDKMGISYIRQRSFGSNDDQYMDRDLLYVSSPDGLSWDFQNRMNVTDFEENDAFRVWADNDLNFDYDDNSHQVFRAIETKINRVDPESSEGNGAMCFIWHWSEATDSFTVAADGWIRDTSDFYGFGSCRTSVCKPQLAIDPSDDYLYLLYERNYKGEFSDPYGYPSTDLWITVSTDNGLNWSNGINITDTHTLFCRRGQCASEIQASLYDVVNDTIHIVYILDKDAGFARDDEGSYTENYVIYQKIPANLIPTTPLLPQFSIREGPPRCHYAIGDINGDGQRNGLDVVYAVNFFKGGNYPTVECNCPNLSVPFYGGADVNGSCQFNGLDITFYVRYLKGWEPRLLFCQDCPPDPL